MRVSPFKVCSSLGIALVLVLAVAGAARAQLWTSVGSSPNASTCLLLTDGSVICQNGEESNNWKRLTPGNDGHYETGAWTDIDHLQAGYGPLYYASAVLPDGRVIVIGGEYNSGTPSCPSNPGCEVNLGAIYDPATNKWTALNAPNSGNSPWNQVGDSPSVVQPDGTFVLANAFSTSMASFDGSTGFTVLSTSGKFDNFSEEGLTLLPDGKILAVNTSSNTGKKSEIYDPVAKTWTAANSLPVVVVNNGGIVPAIVPEIGPQVVRPGADATKPSTVFVAGANQNTAVFDTVAKTWSQGPSFSSTDCGGNPCFAADGPGAILPNGNVLVAASPFFNSPTHFYEFDGTNLNKAASDHGGAGGKGSFQFRMLVIPTGQVLVTNGSSDVELYTSPGTTPIYAKGGSVPDAWRPAITSAPKRVDSGVSYSISGTQFNGLSEGASYGDNTQTSSNYPLVRIINRKTGHVFYAKTHDHSSMGIVAVGSTSVVTTQFDAPTDSEVGELSDLVVVTNGIPSAPFVINGPGLTLTGPISLDTCPGAPVTAILNVCNTGKQDLVINNITSASSLVTVDNPGYSLTISDDFCFPFQVRFSPTPTTTGTLNTTLTIASNDPNTPSATVQVTARSSAPTITATLARGGVFPNTCPASFSDAPVLYVTNSSQCNLTISSITASGTNGADFLPPTVNPSSPLIVPGRASVTLPIRFQPQGTVCSDSSARTGSIVINSDDPANPSVTQAVSGVVPCPHINTTIANTGSFGNVCAANIADLNLQVLNQGECNLNITNIALSNPADFVAPSVSLPLVLSPDANVTLPIRFKPTGTCSDTIPQTSNVTITSNDLAKNGGTVSVGVSGIEGCPKLVLSPQNLNGIFAFPPTVSDPTGNLGCFTDRQITLANAGQCPLTITNWSTAITPDPNPFTNPFSIINPTLPLTIAPGAAPIPLTIRFAPTDLTTQNSSAPDQQAGTLSIFSNDPAVAAPVANLCGEPVARSGIRVLVTDGTAQPINPLKSLTLQSSGLSPQFSQKLSGVVPVSTSVCGGPTITYHLDNETLPPAGTTGSNPKASYTITAQNTSKPISQSFTLGQCEVKTFTLQYK